MNNLYALLMFFSVCSTHTVVRAQETEKYILALSVKYPMNTTARISCDRFVYTFNDFLNINKVYSLDSIKALESLIKHAKYARRQKEIDIRGQVLLYENEKEVASICVDEFYQMVIDGKLIKPNKKLIKFVNALFR